ncbi:MAG: tetratricopeptide repeat protein [Candidatus Omnitrophica bacterium]|nr:tetratricopeptide repeat protein [Candidatus Omnitrophota bacterium]
MQKLLIRYNITAIVCLAFLFFSANSLFAQGQAADYLCELGKSFYSLGKIEDALSEFKKALSIDPNNKTAKLYVNKIFNQETNPTFEYKPLAANTASDINNSIESKNQFSRDQLMEEAMSKIEPNVTSKDREGPFEKKEKDSIKAGPLSVSGQMQLSFGVTPREFIWKRANFDLNEKSKSWRMSSDEVFNNRFNTFDPRIYDSLAVNLDTENKEGLNFHSNLTVDPWSFSGKSNKITLTTAGGDTAEVELLYWSNTAHIVNNTIYGTQKGSTLNIPELKVIDGKTTAITINGFNIPSMKIGREFQPVRELWTDYTNDQIKFRAFPIALQDQAYSSDDPMGITNHHIWWKDSSWLRKYTPGTFHSGNVPVDFTKGIWDDSLSFLTKDSTGQYLTALRGFSFSFLPDEATTFDTTFATPKDLWQDYGSVDNVINASRLKHYFSNNFMAGATFSSRLGFITEPNQKLDSQNYVGGADIAYEMMEGLKAQAEILSSQSFYDMSNATYETKSRGNAYYFSFISRYPQKSLMDLKYGYDEIALDKDESFLLKSKFYLSKMDSGFDASLSSYHETRQDTFWSRHIHFRKPMDYYSSGLEQSTTNWGELNATRIGDGIDAGRNTIGFRIESFLKDKAYNLFDVRNVHNVNGKFIENVVRDEATVQITDKLSSKFLGIYHKLPHTVNGIDPFIYDGNTGDFFINNAVPDGNDPSLMTGSFGLNYDFFEWLSLDGIYERTNDYYLAYDGFPANTLRNDTTLGGTFYQNDNLYRFKNPFLYSQNGFPQAPYDYYNVFKTGLRIAPISKMELYLDYTRNEFESAGQNSDSMNHVGIEMTYMPTKKFGMALKYSYSRWQDTDRLVAGNTNPLGHHNFYGEFRYLPSKDDEFILQYGEGNTSNLGNFSLDPYGGTALTIDTAHILRAYYRRKF